jgi:Fe-S-cluster containining protein
VPLFGHDLFRLVTRRNLDPRRVVFFCEQETPDSVGFRLSADGPTYALALTKKNRLEAHEPCTLLVEQEDGHSRCGVYGDRPITCQIYPMSHTPAGVSLSATALCPPDAWGPDETSNPHWMAGFRRLARYRDTYAEVINRWNAWVDSNAHEPRPSDHFVAYVLQVYARIDRLDSEVGAEALSEIERAWATLPAGSPVIGSRDSEPAWVTYLRRARSVIDEFFPTLPPLPFSRIIIDVNP